MLLFQKHTMTTTTAYLDQSRRHFATLVARTLTIIVGVFMLVVTIFLIFQPSLVILIYALTVVFALIGAATTLAWLSTRPLSQAFLPILLSFFISILSTGLLVTQLHTIAIMCLSLPVILAGLTGDRGTLRLALLFATVTAILMLIPWPLSLPDFGQNLTIFFTSIGIVVPFLIALIAWIIIDRLILIQNNAISLAETRAAEAEHSRDATEMARREVEQRNAEQQRLLELVQTLELPVLNIGRGMLAVPLIGHLDSRRMERIRTTVLESVTRERAHTVIFDISGVTIMDTGVAQNLIQTGQAVRLLGARARLTGISPVIAATLVSLEVNLSDLEPASDLHAAMQQ